MTSSLTWLDFSDAERRRALQVVELLGRTEARDELGLGVIRDTFSGALFPGMSTIQRRARYFLFVPWIYRDIEDRYAGHSDAVSRAHRLELDLIEVLLRSEDTDGVIGSRSRRALRQVPSIIYWQGLKKWKIRTAEGTREQWARQVRQSRGRNRNDDGEIDESSGAWWDPNLVSPPDDWLESATLQLRPEEAAYLRERIATTCAGTVLSVLVERTEPWDEVEFPWLLDIPELPNEAREYLDYARWFSEVMHGAALLYNLEIAKRLDSESSEATQYQAALEGWADSESSANRSSLELTNLWVMVRDLGSQHSRRTEKFIEDWILLASEPDRVLKSTDAVTLIEDRELRIKGRQARLTYDAARETWRGASGAGQLGFRWGSAQRQLLDIVRAGQPT